MPMAAHMGSSTLFSHKVSTGCEHGSCVSSENNNDRCTALHAALSWAEDRIQGVCNLQVHHLMPLNPTQSINQPLFIEHFSCTDATQSALQN